MSKVIYEIIEHDGGFAYRMDGTISETYASHDAARAAAQIAANEQAVGGKTAAISFEDKAGHWHEEIADGGDRPEAEVKG